MLIADLGNLFGTVKFYREARGAGVKPLIGADVWVEAPGQRGGCAGRASAAAGAKPSRLPQPVRIADAGVDEKCFS